MFLYRYSNKGFEPQFQSYHMSYIQYLIDNNKSIAEYIENPMKYANGFWAFTEKGISDKEYVKFLLNHRSGPLEQLHVKEFDDSTLAFDGDNISLKNSLKELRHFAEYDSVYVPIF